MKVKECAARRECEECVQYQTQYQGCDALLKGYNIISNAGGVSHDYAGGKALQVVRKIGGGAIPAVAGVASRPCFLSRARRE